LFAKCTWYYHDSIAKFTCQDFLQSFLGIFNLAEILNFKRGHLLYGLAYYLEQKMFYGFFVEFVWFWLTYENFTWAFILFLLDICWHFRVVMV
jgi:hypothetical protein